jgi:hypothetical protein
MTEETQDSFFLKKEENQGNTFNGILLLVSLTASGLFSGVVSAPWVLSASFYLYQDYSTSVVSKEVFLVSFLNTTLPD